MAKIDDLESSDSISNVIQDILAAEDTVVKPKLFIKDEYLLQIFAHKDLGTGTMLGAWDLTPEQEKELRVNTGATNRERI
ncbi:MAG: hypothetical protein GF364_09835 [Candidatus Lokiarchaeota archaeon]|nr:hypothetical protein [Candidatus Lokiarchaeota archaeon]